MPGTGSIQSKVRDFRRKQLYSEAIELRGEAQDVQDLELRVRLLCSLASAHIDRGWLAVHTAPGQGDDYSEAIELCKDALAIQENNPVATTTQGQAYQKQGNYAEALRHYEAARDQDDTNPTPLNLIASVYRQQDNYDGALAIYREIMRTHRGDHRLLRMEATNIGEVYQEQGDEEKALHTYMRAMGEFGVDNVLLAHTARIHQNRGEYETALKAYRRAKPNITSLQGIGEVYRKQGRYAEAADTFDTILDSHPGNVDALTSIAQILLFHNRPGQASSVYQEALRYQPGSAAALNGPGHISLHSRRYPQALREFQETLEYHPHDREALNGIGQAYLRLDTDPVENAQRALSAFEDALEHHPDDIFARVGLGQARLRLGHFEEAETQFQSVLDRYPDDPIVLPFMLLTEIRLNNLESAQHYMEAIIRHCNQRVITVSLDALVHYAPLGLDAYGALLHMTHGRTGMEIDELMERKGQSIATALSGRRDLSPLPQTLANMENFASRQLVYRLATPGEGWARWASPQTSAGSDLKILYTINERAGAHRG